MGYSLGGLAVIGAFLMKPELFKSAILFHSGASLRTIAPPLETVDPNQFEYVVRKLDEFVKRVGEWAPLLRDRYIDEKVGTTIERDVFRAVCLGDEEKVPMVRELLARHPKRVLRFAGTRNEVMPPHGAKHLDPDGELIDIETLDAQHFDLPAWNRDREKIAKKISELVLQRR